MISPLSEIIVLVLAIIIAVLLYKILKTAAGLAVNAVLGILILVAAKFLLGLEIVITLLAVIICAVGGIFGALLIILLNYFRIGFT